MRPLDKVAYETSRVAGPRTQALRPVHLARTPSFCSRPGTPTLKVRLHSPQAAFPMTLNNIEFSGVRISTRCRVIVLGIAL
jgi:hypothetical protein